MNFIVFYSVLITVPSLVHTLYHDDRGWEKFRDGSDLQHFFTRPELKAPRYSVKNQVPESVTPGYWFVSSYNHVGVTSTTTGKDFVPCMNGAHIYDEQGELIWSGACRYDNRNVFNFRPVMINASHFLTFFLAANGQSPDDDGAVGVMLDSRYQEVRRFRARELELDAHELKVLDDGRSVILATVNSTNMSLPGLGNRKVANTGFQELAIHTGETIFDWNPIDCGMNLSYSFDDTGRDLEDPDMVWDPFHLNSVDKFANGDYLISARHMSAIYRISGTTGGIIWVLGGRWNDSDFVMGHNVPFFWQHDASVLQENETHAIISLFDNQSEDLDRGQPIGHRSPIGKILILDLIAMRAEVLRHFDRPDGGQTALLGGLSMLGDKRPTSSVLINWAMQGYISEYDETGTLVMEAKFVSDRSRTYRAIKADFVGDPSEAPVLKVLPIKSQASQMSWVYYTSWNGATEVASWTIYARKGSDEAEPYKPLGVVKRSGFETSWASSVEVQSAYGIALDIHGHHLASTNAVNVSLLTPPREGGSVQPLGILKAPVYKLASDRMQSTILHVLALVGFISIVRGAVVKFGRRSNKGRWILARYS